jgi:hypothetical protein
MSNLLNDIKKLINEFNVEKEIMDIHYKRWSSQGGFWLDRKVLSYPHHKDETIKYLENWYNDITEICLRDRETNEVIHKFQPRTVTYLLRTYSNEL